jgi:hypothetical protein
MSNAICFDSTWKTPGRASEAKRCRPSDNYLIVYLSSWLSQTWAMPSGKDMQRSPSLVVSLSFCVSLRSAQRMSPSFCRVGYRSDKVR